MINPISIRISLLTYFLLIVGAVAISLISVQYYFSLKLADSAAEGTFAQVAARLGIFIKERDAHYNSVIDLVAQDKNIGHLPEPGRLHDEIDSFINILSSNPDLYALYVGSASGDFYEVISLEAYPGLHQRFQADSTARWAVIHIHGNGKDRLKRLRFLDEQLQTLASQTLASNYEPRVRPWYRKATRSDQVIRTEPYLFSFIDSSGVTYAKRLATGNGVLALDITMRAMNEFLVDANFGSSGEIFLYDRYGEKYASSKPLSQSSGRQGALQIETQPIELTAQERAFVAENPVLRVSNENDWPPLDFAIRGVPNGFSIDYLRLLAQKIGIQWQFVNGYTWSELMDLFAEGQLDMLHSAYHSQERERIALFSQPINEIRTALILRKGLNATGLADLKGKTIALPKGWATVDQVRTGYPEIEVVEYPQSFDAYLAVDRGEADATIDHALSMQYLSSKYGLQNLRLGPWLKEFDEGAARHLFIMLQKDSPILRDLINKAIASVSEEELTQLRAYWQGEGCSSGATDCERQLNRDVVNQAFMQTPMDRPSGLIQFEQDGVRYFAHSAPLATFGDSGHRLGLLEAADSFLSPYMQQVKISLNFAFVILLVTIPVILYAIAKINRPVKALMVENDKIAQRRYADVEPIHTNIRELRDLSCSMIHMAESIQAYEKSQEALMDAFIQLIADAIDAKSPYTAGHCIRVPEIALMLARQAHERDHGPFAPFHLQTEDEWREFRIGAWLHDCGKVTTPEYVVDKATKLETIYNRIHEVRTRFEVLWRDAEISALQRRLQGEDSVELDAWLEQQRQSLRDDFRFIAECNIGGEFMGQDRLERLQQIAGRTWRRHFDNRLGLSEEELNRFADRPAESLPVEEPLLDDRPEHILPRTQFDHAAYQAQGFKPAVPEHLYNYGELYNLSISRGTLTDEERFKINEHIIMTIRMLEALPLPDNLKRVPEYAGTHHETLIGSGYPRQLSADQLSMAARIVTLADIFEALTASDRPYKRPKTLSESIKIMGFMCRDGHIDADVFKLFLNSGIYREYAEKYLLAEQIDEVDIQSYLNCAMQR
ncbi:transporter substrate-binding domain-containing protein [Magnetovirga frankeli]|uniref:HD domain-containing phosphohydrolase n=1 Tax=Magnetovirga frankeli TaxID=947516 RepID=UPI0012940398|nr:transporter substrate-binding domain-containing protein [gamma proteobacterium SS-5]